MNNVTTQPQSQDQHREAQPHTPADFLKADVDSHGEAQAKAQLESIVELVGTLNLNNDDEARENILNDPLSVQVRSGWYTPGQDAEAEEFAGR